jgi:hypothetical protein
MAVFDRDFLDAAERDEVGVKVWIDDGFECATDGIWRE